MSNINKCAYCSNTGPFTDEHVFPAGMGGDDKNYILVNIVCADCNTKKFSPLELSLMRKSPVGVGRKFMQSRSRDRGANTSTPKIQAEEHYIIDGSGRRLEADEDENGQQKLLAQFILEGEYIWYTASNKANLWHAHDAITKLLDKPNIYLINKISPKSFEISRFEWTDEKLEFIDKTISNKAPIDGLWINSPHDSHPDFRPRIYQKTRGGIELKLREQDNCSTILRNLKRNLPRIDKDTDAADSLIEDPTAEIGMPMDIHSSERALAKIGFNFFIHTFGESAANKEDFKKIKSSILTGKPKLVSLTVIEQTLNAFPEIFGFIPEKTHCVILAAEPSNSNTVNIYFIARLYGIITNKTLLANTSRHILLTNPIYFTIDYENNKINRFSRHEYFLNYGNLNPSQ
ncbi:hypothetical protein ACQ9Y2_01545 [Pseudomonas palleroniana]